MDYDKIIAELEASTVKTAKYAGVGANTVKTYIAKLRFLGKNDVLNHKLPEFINTQYKNQASRNSYQIAVLGSAKHSPYFAGYIGEDVIKQISDDNEKTSQSVKGEPKQTMTDKEKENWVPLPTLKKLAKDKAGDFSIQDRLLIALFTQMPPARLDFGNVLILRNPKMDDADHPIGVSNNQNYVILTTKGKKSSTDLVLNEYKTAKTYGQFRETLPLSVTKLIIQLPMMQSHLFQKISGGPYSSPETFGVYLKSVFKRLTDKNMSVDLLRHIYLTDFRKGEKTQEKKTAIARSMMNSVAQQTEYLRLS